MINVGIIGASFRARRVSSRFCTYPGHAGCGAGLWPDGKRPGAQQKRYGITAVYDDWEKMLTEHTLDLVCIATPTVMHAPMTLAAIAKGAHVLCEKPTAMNAREARQMLDAARRANRLHMIDHELRFNPTRMRIAELIHGVAIWARSGMSILAISGPPGPIRPLAPKGDWWSDASMGGGRMGANGSHQIDMLRWWLGEPASVIGQALTIVPDRVCKNTGEAWTATSDDLSHMTLEMQSGALAQVLHERRGRRQYWQ